MSRSIAAVICWFVVSGATSLLLGCSSAPRLFEMRSGAWVNLHHVLYGESLRRIGQPTVGGAGGAGRATGSSRSGERAYVPTSGVFGMPRLRITP